MIDSAKPSPPAISEAASDKLSPNKFVAKMATNCNKPNGQKTIHPLKVNTFIDSLPIDKFFGIGKVTAKKMRNFNIHTGSDLRKLDLPFLIKNFGKSGKKYFDVIRNNSISPVNPNRIRKSIGVEHTFKQDLERRARQKNCSHRKRIRRSWN